MPSGERRCGMVTSAASFGWSLSSSPQLLRFFSDTYQVLLRGVGQAASCCAYLFPDAQCVLRLRGRRN
jgi:hypothetical protein